MYCRLLSFLFPRLLFYLEEVSLLGEAKQKTILFLIADTGAGHRSAANAIHNAIKLFSQQEQAQWLARASHEEGILASEETVPALPPTYRVEIVDVFEEYSRFPLREAVKLYGPTIRYNPKLFGQVFHHSNREKTVLAVNSIATPLILNGLLRLFTTVQPDVVISVHPMINLMVIRALSELGLNIPFITVVTDLVSVHFTWFAPGADAYIVPTEQARALYCKRGLDPSRVHMLGMPIDPKFTQPVDSKEDLRRKLGLRPDLPVVLLVGGGDGAGGLQSAVRAISQARLSVQLLVVTGRNKRLYANLQRSHARLHVPATILGFVQNMPELMHAADVIVTKAGPGTICEALACGLPIILSGYVPGQEEGNIDFVVGNGVGMLALDPATLIDSLRRLLKPGSEELRRFLENARRIRRPDASFDIARHILRSLPEEGEDGVWHSVQWQQRQHTMTGRLRSAIRLSRFPARLRTKLPAPSLRRFLRSRTRDLSDADGAARFD
jgi:1,2-diacylglycerol 3-beta-galactosyltransferase